MIPETALYQGSVLHQRFRPRPYRLEHGLFLFGIRLSDLDRLPQFSPLLARNRFALYSFYDSDHFTGQSTVQEELNHWLEARGLPRPHEAYMVTHLRILGYVFNPVTFFFCYDAQGRHLGTVAEVHNTYHERKPYWVPASENADRLHSSTERKDFYISPFSPLDIDLKLHLHLPAERLDLVVDDHDAQGRLLHARLQGRKRPLSSRGLLAMSLRYPLTTLRIITLIHWHALILWAKRLPYFEKQAHEHLERDILSRPTDRRTRD